MPQSLIVQGVVAAGFGAGLLLLRNVRLGRIDERVRSDIVSKNRDIACILSRLAEMGQQEKLERIMDKVERVLSLSDSRSPSTQWHISRLNGEILRDARRMCDSVSALADEDVFYSLVVARDELLPQLESLLEAVLHNHILDSKRL